MQPLIITADDRASGLRCSACEAELRAGEPVAICSACGASHHRACWERGAGCGSYNCAPANRGDAAAPATQSGLVITAEQLNRAEPLTARPAFRGLDGAAQDLFASKRPKTSGTAIAAAICAVGGIPLFGILTGAVAVVLASISFGAIRAGARRGVWLASGALLLGLADVVGWAFVLSHFLGGGSHLVAFNTADFKVSEQDLRAATPVVAASLRANVLICRIGALDAALGSGVIISIKDGSAVILTNRHVLSHAGDTEGATVSVRFVNGSMENGTVAWVAPEGLDIALVRVAASDGIVAARIDPQLDPQIGEDVFAVGNPQGLGWTHTKGAISQFRERRGDDQHSLRVIQTSAPINPGNSGGGLYSSSGSLIGINTWAGDKRDSEGLGFAISIKSICAALPEWALQSIAPPAAPETKTKSGEDAP